MRASIYVAALVFFSFQQTAKAEFLTGNQLHEICGTNKQLCEMFVIGLTDGILHNWRLITNEGTEQKAALVLCLQQGISSRQLRDIVTRYLEMHPESRHLTAAFLSVLALQGAFPCQ